MKGEAEDGKEPGGSEGEFCGMSAIQYCYKQNRYQQLRGFCYSAVGGSISAAARRLKLSQPSVTQQIQALERELGVQLFDRCQGGIHLTRDGQLLFEMTISLIEQLESVEGRFQRIRSGEKGELWLRVAAGQTSLLWILPEAIERFKKEYPQINLRIEPLGFIGQGEGVFQRLRERGVDFAVGAFNQIPEDMEFVPIRRSQMVLVAPIGNEKWEVAPRITLEQISQWPLILPPKSTRSRALIEAAFGRAGLVPRVSVEVAGWEVVKKFVLAGMGIGLVKDLCLTGEEELWVIPLEEFVAPQTYGFAFCRNRALSLAARWFTSQLHPGAEALSNTAGTPFPNEFS